MWSPASNCCRVDAVKASANQLKMQLSQVTQRAAVSATQAVAGKLQAVEAQIKVGHADQAEVALASAKSAIQQLLYTRPGASPAQGSGEQPALGGRVDLFA